MSREIKFRAWCENSGEYIMIDEYLFINKENNHGMGADFTNDYPCVTKVIDVMQYTGLKDKNGKEIYEGDILKVCNGSINGMGWYDKPYSVEYKPEGYDICMFCWNNDGESIMDNTHWCEVIGNIYENPELLSE